MKKMMMIIMVADPPLQVTAVVNLQQPKIIAAADDVEDAEEVGGDWRTINANCAYVSYIDINCCVEIKI